MCRVVIDTNVLVATLRSRKDASFATLNTIGQNWRPIISVALILEHEAVLKREAARLGISELVVNAILMHFVAARSLRAH